MHSGLPPASQYADVVQLATAHPATLALEGAYANYRAGNLEAVAQAVTASGDSSPAWAWLSAQTQYRRGLFPEAAAAYEKLASTGEEEVEAAVNLTAALVAGGLDTDPAITPALKTETEVAFNLATGSLLRGDTLGALGQLSATNAAAKQSLAAEGLSAADIDEETRPLRMQAAVALHRLGFTADAAETYAAMPATGQAGVLATNNTSVLRSSREVFEAFKRTNSTLAAASTAKLQPGQVAALRRNQAALLAHMKKHADALAALPQGDASPMADAIRAIADEGHAPRTAAGFVARAATQEDPAARAASLRQALPLSQEAALATTAAAFARAAVQAGQDPADIASCVLEACSGANPALVAASAVLVAAGHAAAAEPLLAKADASPAADALQGMASAKAGPPPSAALPGAWTGDVQSLVQSKLPWVSAAPHPAARAPATAQPPPAAAAAGAGDAPVAQAPSLPQASGSEVQLPAAERAAKRKIARLRRRARRREAYLAFLREKPSFKAGIPLPKPDPERWLPYRLRSRDRFGNRKRSAKAAVQHAGYKNTGSSQGTVGVDTEKVAAALDARAIAEAKKAAGGEPAAEGKSKKGSTAAAPKVAVKRRAKNKKGGRRR